jgi:hypothetical protein
MPAAQSLRQLRKPKPRRYRLFGLVVESDIVLAGVQSAPRHAAVDVAIVRTAVDHPAATAGAGMTVSLDLPRQLFAWDAVGRFVVASEDRIEVEPNRDAADSLVALPLLGVVFAALLQRRGLVVLHASAVVIGGHAVGILGDKGAGKSTIAAALVAAGHDLLSDDVVAIDFTSVRGPLVVPAYGHLKLWDESAAAIPLAAENRGRLHPSLTKSSYALQSGFAASAAPLTRLYVLSRGDRAMIADTGTAEAVSALVRFSYMGRFGAAGFGTELAAHFLRCAELARGGAIRTLQLPPLDRITEGIAAIERDLARGASVERWFIGPQQHREERVQ